MKRTTLGELHATAGQRFAGQWVAVAGIGEHTVGTWLRPKEFKTA